MKRFTVVVTAAVASGVLAAAAIGTGMPSAAAAAHPSARVAAHKADRQGARKKMPGGRIGRPPHGDPVHIVSQNGSGQYVSVVNCRGEKVPPPLHLRKAGTPIRLTGGKPTRAVTRALRQRGRYKTVYTCTVVIKKELAVPAGKGGGIKPCAHGQGGTGTGAGTGAGRGTGKGTGTCGVVLNTGFGGASHSVSRHHPRH